jgi:hypothetical protein
MSCERRLAGRPASGWLGISLVLAFCVAMQPAVALPPSTSPEQRSAPRWTLEEILTGLRVAETGGCPMEGRQAVGDHGRAIGPFQIHEAYWRDSGIPGRFEDCRDTAYARSVVVAFWKRYCPEALAALDAEVLVRVHNGGPDGAGRECTERFWRKFERELLKQRSVGAAGARR